MLEVLIHKQKIEDVLIRYATACDRRDWKLLDHVFDVDVEVNYGGEYKISGREALVEMIKSMLGGCGPTQHLLGNFKINQADDLATCSCYVRAVHAGVGDKSEQIYEVWAEYKDHLSLVEGEWLIDKREMVVHKEVGSREVLAPE